MKHFLLAPGAAALFALPQISFLAPLYAPSAAFPAPDAWLLSLSSVKALVVSVVTLLLAALVAAVCIQQRRYARLRDRFEASRRRSSDRLRLIRNLLDLCYVYQESPHVFLEKFRDRVHIRQIKSDDLVETCDARLSALKEDDRLLVMLFEEGFTQRELCVVYGMKKIGTLYVRYHRIRKRLRATDMQPAAFRRRAGRAVSVCKKIDCTCTLIFS